VAKLKLDLHPIFNDSARIEAALAEIFAEAEARRIEEVEIIPGKGSGALKKTVIRYLERPDVKSRYHRIVKDSDNWGRLFVYFRWPPKREEPRKAAAKPGGTTRPEGPAYDCYFCRAANRVGERLESGEARVIDCAACGSPNRLSVHNRRGAVIVEVESGY
jgi:hypothetical protein